MSLPVLMENVEKIQYQAALAVTGAWDGSSRVKLYEELGWESLSDRRMCRRVLQIHKIVTEKTPVYLRDKLPANRRTVINLPNVFQALRCRTDRYLKSFFPDATRTWNNVITNFDSLPSYEVLKGHLTSFIRPCMRSTFDIHNPSHLRYLFQLRLGLSHLRYHKKAHGFIDTPSDNCLCNNGVEDTLHYLFHCSLYTNHRTLLISNVEEILNNNNLNLIININAVETFLYGHPSLGFLDNQNIVQATLEYIKSTNRFVS